MRDKTIRCDGCGSEAWVSVKRTLGNPNNGEVVSQKQLDFCAHHYNKHSIILHAEGWSISNDERDLINSKPSVSV